MFCYCCSGIIECAVGMFKLIGACECTGCSVLAERFRVIVGIVGRAVIGSSFLCASVIGVMRSKYSAEPSRGLMLRAGGLIGGSGIFSVFWHNSPQWARASSFTRYLDNTQRRNTEVLLWTSDQLVAENST